MSPGMQASPTTKMFASIFDFMFSGSIGQKPDWSARLASRATLPAICAGMTLASAALAGEIGLDLAGLRIDALDAAVHLRVLPLHHAGVVPLPAVEEERLLGEGRL